MTIKKWLLETAYIQTLITCISLPILSWHGIPFNPMGIVATTLFLPCIASFLFVSTLFFFTQLLCIPNGFLTTGLNYIATAWLTCLQYHPRAYTLCFAKPPSTLLFIWIIIAIVSLAALTTRAKQLIALCANSAAYILAILLFFTPRYQLLYIDGFPFLYYHIKKVHGLVTIDSTRTLLAQKNWKTYHYAPTLIKKTGCQNPDVVTWLPRSQPHRSP